MFRFAADENFNNNIIRGLWRRKPELDILRVQDVGLNGAPDSLVLEWAAKENRILLTHDVSTITKFAYGRIEKGEFVAGVFEVDIQAPIGEVIESIVMVVESSTMDEWSWQIGYIPF